MHVRGCDVNGARNKHRRATMEMDVWKCPKIASVGADPKTQGPRKQAQMQLTKKAEVTNIVNFVPEVYVYIYISLQTTRVSELTKHNYIEAI